MRRLTPADLTDAELRALALGLRRLLTDTDERPPLRDRWVEQMHSQIPRPRGNHISHRTKDAA